jgi:hypothetical protein
MTENEKTQNVKHDSAANAFADGMQLPGTNLPDSTKAEFRQQQEFITKFGIDLGTQYLSRGLSIQEAMEEHTKFLEGECDKLKAQLAAMGKR